MLGDIA